MLHVRTWKVIVTAKIYRKFSCSFTVLLSATKKIPTNWLFVFCNGIWERVQNGEIFLINSFKLAHV